MTTTTSTLTGERADLLEALAAHRYFLRYTVQGLTDEQARQRTTASELTLGGLVKHVAAQEAGWVRFILEGPESMPGPDDPEQMAKWAEEFRMGPDETLEGVLARYEEVAARTDELVRTLPDLDASHPLPEAPWFQPGARRSARRVFLHIVAETAQHAGHADILRESLDGQKTMG
ncbi:DinB family protein [Geodermatophilus sp. SYSU D01186]